MNIKEILEIADKRTPGDWAFDEYPNKYRVAVPDWPDTSTVTLYADVYEAILNWKE